VPGARRVAALIAREKWAWIDRARRVPGAGVARRACRHQELRAHRLRSRRRQAGRPGIGDRRFRRLQPARPHPRQGDS